MEEAGKRVSWVELYLDLVFVLAVGQLAHLIVGEPEMRSVWIALGLFVALWWTWVGFAVLYNRRGADTPAQRLLFLVGSVPAGVAAVAIEPVASGDVAAFAISLAVIRLVLAGAQAGGVVSVALLGRRIVRAYLASAGLFVLSLAVHEPLRYVLWGVAIALESSATLTGSHGGLRRARRRHDLTSLVPQDPSLALDPSHFAERFGLLVIILLGEVVVEAGQASASGRVASVAGWAALVAAMVLAAALWWLYFDTLAEINLTVLRVTGGSPATARGVFAVGHMVPAFALLLTAAGVGLLLEESPPPIAYWLACVGIGIYVAGTRGFLRDVSRVPRVIRIAMLVATFQLAHLQPELTPHRYLWVLTGWVVLWAALRTRTGRGGEERLLGEA